MIWLDYRTLLGMNVQHYDFKDDWLIDAPLHTTWEAISDSAGWETWWPGLQSAKLLTHNPEIINSSVALSWRSKSGYTLRHQITITSVDADKTIEFTSKGDLSGSGSWTFEAAGTMTRMHIRWEVVTTKKWMNRLALILRPIFEHNHHVLMKRGEAGLSAYLKSQP